LQQPADQGNDANILEISGATFGYFTMEYIPGGTLERYWCSYENNLMPVEEVIDVIKQACSGLAVAHSENPPVIHRDIKPQNILIGYDSGGMRVKVSDFGLAKRVNPMTLLASAKGTLGSVLYPLKIGFIARWSQVRNE